MSILNDIGLKYGTDKSSRVHNYLTKYEKYFPFSRCEGIKILEIGVLDGASLKVWEEYYYNSTIIGIDINPEAKKYEGGRIKIEIGSQFDYNFLKYVSEKYGKFDMILDDGSHINEHVIFSFKNLFNSVKSKGIYVVEDVCTSYWSDYGGSINGLNTTISFFKTIIDELNFFGEFNWFGINAHSRDDTSLIEQFNNKGIYHLGLDIESIIFLNSVILINKR